MRTYSGDNAGSEIEPRLWQATKSIWICSPWVGKSYIDQLIGMAAKGIDVRLITTNDELNIPTLEQITGTDNRQFQHIIIDRKEEKLIHSKMYVIDGSYAVTGSANFTYSGMHVHSENLVIFEDTDEVKNVEYDFMKLWMTFEQKKMEIEKLTKIDGNTFKIKSALPLKAKAPEVVGTRKICLTFHPYYRIEYIFKTASKIATEKLPSRGVVIIDATNMEIQDDLIAQEFHSEPIIDQYSIKKTDYPIFSNQSKIAIGPAKALEIFMEHIVGEYSQQLRYNLGLSSEKFYAYERNFHILSNDLVYLPIWQVKESEESTLEQLFLGSSGTLWAEAALCVSCGSPTTKSGVITCGSCFKHFCKNCVVDKGRFIKIKYCKKCASML